MYAYSQVDAQTRRKLEELLKTWREPIQNSLSTTPVFPISSTQPIVDTLNRYRTSTPQLGRGPQTVPSRTHYQGTSTPPQTATGMSPTVLTSVQSFGTPNSMPAVLSQPQYQQGPMQHQVGTIVFCTPRIERQLTLPSTLLSTSLFSLQVILRYSCHQANPSSRLKFPLHLCHIILLLQY